MREYPIIKSAPYCCFAASLESILKRHGVNDITQYDIANEIGVTFMEDEKECIPENIVNVSFSSEYEKLGMHIYKDTLDKLFKHFKLPFHELYISWNEIADWNFEQILQSVSSEDDVIIYYDFGHLYHEERNKGIGHTGVFVSIDEDSMIEFVNPGPRFIGHNKSSVDDLVDAIKSRHGGLSIIKKVY